MVRDECRRAAGLPLDPWDYPGRVASPAEAAKMRELGPVTGGDRAFGTLLDWWEWWGDQPADPRTGNPGGGWGYVVPAGPEVPHNPRRTAIQYVMWVFTGDGSPASHQHLISGWPEVYGGAPWTEAQRINAIYHRRRGRGWDRDPRFGRAIRCEAAIDEPDEPDPPAPPPPPPPPPPPGRRFSTPEVRALELWELVEKTFRGAADLGYRAPLWLVAMRQAAEPFVAPLLPDVVRAKRNLLGQPEEGSP